ncbi:hypothetical protein [Nocardioides sp. Leaf285]|uniref:hypothetical protein n=1 Tax=Nocardioides sp. Leaf285 TaxID=1736322 RepID=UPI000AFCCBE6|nr:hypothetical protein [Nocardioides sp. Leaf285]
MSKRTVELERSDALEQYAYAAVVDDAVGMQAALDRYSAAAPDDGEPSDAVKSALIDADPVAAAAAGWMTFHELVAVVAPDPEAYLDPDEVAAFEAAGPHILRRVVASRKAGETFTAGTKTSADARSNKSAFALAARGRALDPEALVRLLKEHGLEPDDEDLNE